MQTAKIFMNGKSQAVRLPKEFRFSGDEVVIKKFGGGVLLLPMKYRAADLESLLGELEPGFRIEREQPGTQQKRRAIRSK